MNDFRITPGIKDSELPELTPAGKLSQIGEKEYVRRFREKQNEFLQKYLDSEKAFEDHNKKTVAADAVKYIELAKQQKPTINAISDLGKTLEKLNESKSITKDEEIELNKLLGQVDNLTDKGRAYVLTLLKKKFPNETDDNLRNMIAPRAPIPAAAAFAYVPPAPKRQSQAQPDVFLA